MVDMTLASADFQTFKRILSTEDKTHACERSLRRILGDDDFLRWKERVSKGLARGTVAELRRYVVPFIHFSFWISEQHRVYTKITYGLTSPAAPLSLHFIFFSSHAETATSPHHHLPARAPASVRARRVRVLPRQGPKRVKRRRRRRGGGRLACPIPTDVYGASRRLSFMQKSRASSLWIASVKAAAAAAAAAAATTAVEIVARIASQT